MSRVEALEPRVHGRARDTTNDDELHFGVTKRMAYATNTPGIEGAQWTGIVTQVGRQEAEVTRRGARRFKRVGYA